MTEARHPLDTALDLLVYVPVGLAVTAAEEFPKLASKGRNRLTTQLAMARVVGQFAVTRGREELERRFSPPRPAAEPSTPVPAEAETFDEMAATNGSEHPPVATGPGAGAGTRRPGIVAASTSGTLAAPPADIPAATPAPAGPAPATGSLAIPGYDSLSASQVVQRLAGLSPGELDAVGAYERANRGRRTILNRIDQLQGR